MDNGLEISRQEVELGSHVKLVVQLKANNNRLFVDLRKWFQFPNNTEYWPTKKGITLDMDQWIRAIQIIQKIIEDGK